MQEFFEKDLQYYPDCVKIVIYDFEEGILNYGEFFQ